LYVQVVIYTNNLHVRKLGDSLLKSLYPSHNRGDIGICCIDIHLALFSKHLCKVLGDSLAAQFVIRTDIGEGERIVTGL